MRVFRGPLGNRLFARLSVAFACALLVSFGLAAALTVMPLRRSIENESETTLRNTAEQVLGSVQRFMISRCDDVRLWGTLLPASPAGTIEDAKQADALLARIVAGSPLPWRLLAVVARDGSVVASSRAGPRAGEIDGDPGQPAGDPIGCGVALRSGGEPALVVTHAVGGAGLRLVGIMDWAPIRDRVQEARFEDGAQDRDAFIVLLDDRTTPLVEPKSPPTDMAAILGAVGSDQGTPVAPTVVGDAGAYLRAEAGPAPAWIGAPALRVVAFRSVQSSVAASDLIVGRIVHAAGVGLILAACLSFIIARDLTRRLVRLIDGTRRLAAGETPAGSMDDGGTDEIGDLARAFDAMAADIARVRAELEGSVAHRTAELRLKSEALHHALRETEAAARAKSQFLANVSHEIRTPLNGIIGMTALALDAELAPDVRAHLTHVKASADSLLGLVNDILDFSRIETRRLRLEPIPFRLHASMEDIVRDFMTRAAPKGLAVGLEIDPAVPEDLIGDPGRLRQILVSLLGNAVKFTERGRVDLAIGVDTVDAEGPTLRFTVRDTGIGIAADKLALIFEPFTQVDGSSTRRHGGAGLGLALASQLVDMMKGRIWVESAPGAGSAFHFTARFRIAPGAGAHPPVLAVALPAVRVLVVDDNLINRRLLETRLRNWGLRPESTSDGARALDLLRGAAAQGDPFALALVDMQMPQMDGFELAEHVKGEPDLAATRMLMLTSAGQRGDAARCRSIGVEGYLTKPTREADLRDALAVILRPSVPVGGDALITRHALRENRPDGPETVAEDETATSRAPVAAPEAPIDPVDLLGRVEGDRALLSELVRAFLSTAPGQMSTIDAALERGEGAALLRAAHTLKGSVGTFGAIPALRAAARLETCADRGDLDAARLARHDLSAEMARLAGALTPYVRGDG